MAKVYVYHNTNCLCCNKCEEVMVKIGPMVFCNDCFKMEFVDKGVKIEEIDTHSKIYSHWINKYKNS